MPKRKAPECDLSDEQKRQAKLFVDMGFPEERAEEAPGLRIVAGERQTCLEPTRTVQ